MQPRLSFDGTRFALFHSGQYMAVMQDDVFPNIPGTTVSSAPGTKEHITADALEGVHLAAWSDGRSSGTNLRDIYAIRMNGNGTHHDQNAIAIATTTADESRPEVRAIPGGWLVAWVGANGNAWYRRVLADLRLGEPIEVNVGVEAVARVRLAWGGTRALLLMMSTNGSGLHGAFIDANGALVEGPFETAEGAWPPLLGGAASLGQDQFLELYSQYDPVSRNPQVRARAISQTTLLGTECDEQSDCGPNACVDGVCCSSACGSGVLDDCRACSVDAGGLVNGVCTLRRAAEVCRPSQGVCDTAEACTGSASSCPADVRLPSGTMCRGSAGDCDVTDYCNGGVACTADAREPATKVCRAATNACDRVETCAGGVVCPDDRVLDEGAVCLVASGACDAPDTCDGRTKICAEVRAEDGTSCDDGLACNGASSCAAAKVPFACSDDGDSCTAETCQEPGTCMHVPIAGCCHVPADCDDGDACTVDDCSLMRCTHAPDPICTPPDGGIELDGGDDAGSDAGEPTDETTSSAGGCTCTATRTQSPGASVLVALVLVLGLVRRRRVLRHNRAIRSLGVTRPRSYARPR